jgi:hypothetical protein
MIMTCPFTPETVAAILAAAGFAEYRDDQFGFAVTSAAFGGEIIVDLRGVDLLPFNPGEGPRALLDDYTAALADAGCRARISASMVIVSPAAEGRPVANPDADVRLGDVFDFEGVPRAPHRHCDVVAIPAMEIGLAGIAQLRKALDEGEAGITGYAAGAALRELPGADLPETCAWHGGEGDGWPGCPGCREDQGAAIDGEGSDLD